MTSDILQISSVLQGFKDVTLVSVPLLQENRSAGIVVLQTTVARNGGPTTYNTRNVGLTRPLFLVTLLQVGPRPAFFNF